MAASYTVSAGVHVGTGSYATLATGTTGTTGRLTLWVANNAIANASVKVRNVGTTDVEDFRPVDGYSQTVVQVPLSGTAAIEVNATAGVILRYEHTERTP